MSRTDGMNYAPKGKPNPVVKPGDFAFAAVGLDHGHIHGMCNGLVEAGAECRLIYDDDAEKAAQLQKSFPHAVIARSMDEVLGDPKINLVAAASVPCERGPLGLRVMAAGKDYFVDKTPFTSLDQLSAVRQAVTSTGRKYMVYYSERLHVECAVFAEQLISSGVLGRIVQVIGLGPHRLNAPSRPAWFFQKEKYGGILCDIGSHQIDQFLAFSGAKDASVVSANVANYHNKTYPELEDFGDAHLVADNGAVNYFRVDWLNPDGLGTWGDGRAFILGTEGYLELRKYIDVGRDTLGDQVYLVTQKGEKHMNVTGQVGYPFFGRLILDCLNRTENAMTQSHAFKAAELCLKAQSMSRRIE